MDFHGFRVFLGHVFSIAVDIPLIISKGHSLEGTTHSDSSDTIIRLNSGLMFAIFVQIPFCYKTSLISKHDRALIWMQGCTVDRFVIFVLFSYFFRPDVMNSQSSVFTCSVYQFLFFTEASNSVYVAFEGLLEDAGGSGRFAEVKYFGRVVHTDHYFVFSLGYFETNGR